MPTLPTVNLPHERRHDFSARLRALAAKCAEDNISPAAGAVAFFSLLAAFPGLGILVSLYGMIADTSVIERHISFVSGLLPEAMVRLLSSDLHGFLEFQRRHWGLSLVLCVFFTATCGRTAVASLVGALNVVYRSKDRRRVLRKQGLSLMLVAGTVVFVAITFTLVALTPLIVYYLVPLSRGWRHAIDYLRWPLMALITMAALTRLYELAPHHEHRRRNWLGLGPAIATGLWLLFSVGYSLYLEQVGSYNVIYGSVSSTVVLLIWLYLSNLAVLLGAEIDAIRRARAAEIGEGET